MTTRKLFFAQLVCFALLLASASEAQLWRTSSGYDALEQELGAGLPLGNGIIVSQVEAPAGNGGYKANPNDSDFLNPSKNFIDESGINNINSGHANNVGTFFFSNQVSAAPGILEIHQYEANDWINRVTGFASTGIPFPQPYVVQNHSWIGNGLSNSIAEIISQRIDYIAKESDVMMTVGVANGGNSVPQLLAHTFNSISVGRTDGEHASGLTQFYGDGRVKPEIVSVGSATSWAAPRVGAAAAILREAADGTNANNHETIKAILLAGATKVEFPNWSRTVDVPIDTNFGAGELNTYNSYKILMGGETDGQTSMPSMASDPIGWDHGTIMNGESMNYLIELTEPADYLSIVLTWDIDVVDSNTGAPFVPQSTLSNLDLFFTGNGVADGSVSTGHNIEHIFVRDLEPGTYSFAIVTNRTNQYSIAWKAATKNAAPINSVSTTIGSVTNGTILNVRNDDDNYLEIQPAPIIEEGVWGAAIEMETTTPVLMENGIQVDMQIRVNTPNVEQEIEIFNFTDESFETINVSDLATVDTDTAAEVTGELYDFVDPDSGNIRARVTWRQKGPVFLSPWTIFIDRAEFVVSN